MNWGSKMDKTKEIDNIKEILYSVRGYLSEMIDRLDKIEKRLKE